jgi:hypothetical protein
MLGKKIASRPGDSSFLVWLGDYERYLFFGTVAALVPDAESGFPP